MDLSDVKSINNQYALTFLDATDSDIVGTNNYRKKDLIQTPDNYTKNIFAGTSKGKVIGDIVEDEDGLYSFEDYNITLDWYNFHKDNCLLRAVCKSCNLSRGYEKSL